MDVNAQNQNQSYWLLFREDQSNVIFSSNNFTIQNPTQITAQEARYIVSTSENNRQYIQINEVPTAPAPQELPEACEPEVDKQKVEDNFWDRNKIMLLLTLCLENKLSSTSGAKERALWDNIAATIGTTAEECYKKYRNLRRTYIRLLKEKKMGRHIKWVHFNLCDEIYKEYKSPTLLEPWEDLKIRRLLSLYIENLHRFRNPDILQKDIWKEIAIQIGSTEYSCYHKFKNLKRTYLTWLERSREKIGKFVKKWPYQHFFERIFYNYNPILKPWDRFKTKQLLDAYAQYSHKFQNPKFQKKELWKEISTMVGESPIDCDRKFRNLKHTYVKLKSKMETSRHTTKWRYFKDFEALFSSFHSEPHRSTDTDQEDYISQLLQFYVDHKVKFRDPLTKKKNLWKLLSPKLGMSPEECDRKFRNLKQTYVRLAERKEPGQQIKWPYFSYFEQIYGSPSIPRFESREEDATEMSRAAKDVQERKENDRKFERLLALVEESNCIQRERNRILQALISQK
ncbi:uncharacterized protein LOC134675143 [Cydia fagiglandana]|uniref:uncharacterized protein LOC134675143 n=1 Tax=Cydia fagiglandana TaxID=1458189 RepID=UPI002FEE5FBC